MACCCFSSSWSKFRRCPSRWASTKGRVWNPGTLKSVSLGSHWMTTGSNSSPIRPPDWPAIRLLWPMNWEYKGRTMEGGNWLAGVLYRDTSEAILGQSSGVAWSVVGGPKYSRPVYISLQAGPWTGILCCSDRSSVILSICEASCGKCSHIWIPGTLVEIGLKSPRTSAGALGFMSHKSMWLGPPNKKIKTQAWCFPW